MGVALLAWGRFFGPHGERVTVPAPVDGRGAPWLLDFLTAHVRALHNVGFTAIQLPPTSKAQGGAGPGCDGYGVFDPRDIGGKNQQGSVATRYGTKASLPPDDLPDAGRQLPEHGAPFSIDVTYLAPQII